MVKTIILTGIDSTGKSTLAKSIQSKIPGTYVRKYPYDQEIKNHINAYYNKLVNSGNDLHESAINNMYKQIHDLYDRDFRKPFTVPEGTKLVLFDRYFIDNIVYSRLNGVEKLSYSEDHFYAPIDLVIFLESRNYTDWKKTFKMKGDENIREPAILFYEVQKQYGSVLENLQAENKIKNFIRIYALESFTEEEVMEAIEEEVMSLTTTTTTTNNSN